MPCSGSRIPQSCLEEALVASSVSLVTFETAAALPFLPFFLPFPAPAVSGWRALDDTAALRPAKRSLQYCVWPSLAPFSIGPSLNQFMMSKTAERLHGSLHYL